ncbi:hypothetical protein [Vibrio tapetis]|uniref:Putative Exonuclease SbcC n=1 Tax=Vibrio tapetis subsp. tapetis TaxID=1671868 RepID=A0A2N8ZFB3_9VIBR|nr:hypothetical protein [Vibrio tapetis]SON50555.1 putative Exonuclease SbcC [Vibrio tapetis subsp. tapetis]
MAEYDQKNQEKYDKNTDKIWSALDAIRQDKNLKATKAQVSKLTGLHRNTLGGKGSRDWVGLEIELITKQRDEDSNRTKVTKKKQEENLQGLLDQSKLEILHWFTKYSESERDLEKLRIRSARDYDSLEWHKAELRKERKLIKSLEERVVLLENILKTSE